MENQAYLPVVEIHEGMLDGIRTGDATAAVKWIRKDIETPAAWLIDVLRQKGSSINRIWRKKT